MRTSAFAFLAFGLSTLTYADGVDEHFAAGIGGVSWGMKLDDLIAIRPGGHDYFSTAPGERMYAVHDDEPLFGIPRSGMRVQYHFGKDNEVRSIGIGLSYERREQLLSELLLLFGRYEVREEGTAIHYFWPAGRRVQIGVRASREPKNGILEFWMESVSPRGQERRSR